MRTFLCVSTVLGQGPQWAVLKKAEVSSSLLPPYPCMFDMHVDPCQHRQCAQQVRGNYGVYSYGVARAKRIVINLTSRQCGQVFVCQDCD